MGPVAFACPQPKKKKDFRKASETVGRLRREIVSKTRDLMKMGGKARDSEEHSKQSIIFCFGGAQIIFFFF